MATLRPGTAVALPAKERAVLQYPPGPALALGVAVHPDALKAGPRNRLTLVLGLAAGDREPAWLGALDETMLTPLPGQLGGLRALLAPRLLVGSETWTVIQVRGLVTGDPWRPYRTVYAGTRPWVVLGELHDGQLLAAPLNDSVGNPKWFTPVLRRTELQFRGSTKDVQLELAHLWSLPGEHVVLGRVAPQARDAVAEAVRGYFGSGQPGRRAASGGRPAGERPGAPPPGRRP